MLTYPEMKRLEATPHDERSAHWVAGLRLVESGQLGGFRRIGCGSCAAACFPDAPHEVVQLAADQISFLFLFDDLFAEGTYRFDPPALRAALQPFAELVR